MTFAWTETGLLWHRLSQIADKGVTQSLFDRPWTLVLILVVLLAGLAVLVARRIVLRGIVHLVQKRPWHVLSFAVVLLVLSLATVPFLKVSTSRTNLLDKDNPYQRQLVAFLREFGSPNHLIGVVEGGRAEERRQAADELARAVEQTPGLARFVFYKVDLAQMRRQGLLYLPVSELRRLRHLLANPDDPEAVKRIRGFLQIRSLDGLLQSINKAFDEAMANPDAAMKEKGGLQEGLKMLDGVLDEIAAWVKDPNRKEIRVMKNIYYKKFDLSKSNLDDKGYLADRHRKRLFLFIRPATDSDETRDLIPVVEKARALAGRVVRHHKGVRIGFTGYPALQVDEMETLKHDMFFTTVLALIGTIILFALMFRSGRQTALAVAALSTGLIWSLGFTVVAYGHLNLVTSLFFAILIGLGIDFSIHVLSRFNEELAKGGDRIAAVGRALEGVGPGLLTGALTTAAAFYATAITKFTAFSELGVIAGSGLLLELLASITVLPALLVVTRPPKRARARAAAKAAQDSPAHSGARAVAAARFVVRWPAAIIVTAALITVPTLVRRPHIPFDYNITGMLPHNTQSREYYVKMVNESNFSAEFINVVADSLSDARELTRRLSRLPTVARVESIAQAVPDKQVEKLRILQTMRPIFQGIETRYSAPPAVTVQEIDRQLEDLYDKLDDAHEKAARVHRPEARDLKKLMDRVQRTRDALKKVSPQLADQRLNAMQVAMMKRLSKGLTELKAMLNAKAITPESLPEGIKDRFLSKDKNAKTRRYALYVYPKKSIWNRAFLGEFVKEARSIDPKATGFPVSYYEHVRMIQSGYVQASFLAGLAIVIMLLLDFSRARFALFGIVPIAVLSVWSYAMVGWLGGLGFLILGMIGMAIFDWRAVVYTLLAVIPLAMGAAWMVSMMGLFKIPYTLANIVALPLIIGIGVVYAVHILHRFREEHGGDVYMVVRHTGGAVLLAALTTMVGFGSLITASHGGAKTMGETMVIGVTTCLITAVVVLPALLRYVPWLCKVAQDDPGDVDESENDRNEASADS